MPAFLVLVLLEKLYGWYRGDDTVPLDDAVSSLSSGMTNVLKDVLGLSVSIITYEWLVGEMALFTIENTIVVYFIAFMVIDFYGYLTHRISHKINYFGMSMSYITVVKNLIWRVPCDNPYLLL